jgi:hypothetical protein
MVAVATASGDKIAHPLPLRSRKILAANLRFRAKPMMTRHQLQAAFTFLIYASAAAALGSPFAGAQTPGVTKTQDAPKTTEQNGVPNQMALALRVEKAHGGASN